MGEVTLIAAAIVRGAVPKELSRDGGGCTIETAGDLPDAVPALGKRRDALTLEA